MHGDVGLRGPVWAFATAVIVIAIALALFVALDVYRRYRLGRSSGVSRPLWLHTVLPAVFLSSLVAAQLLPGISLMSAVPVVAAPFTIAGGVAYLLKVVYPTPPSED